MGIPSLMQERISDELQNKQLLDYQKNQIEDDQEIELQEEKQKFEIIFQNGENKTNFQCRFYFIQWQGNQSILITLQNNQNFENNIKDLQKQIKQYQKILQTVSHDIKSPLNCIINTALSLQDNLEPDEIKQKQEMILNNSNLAIFLLHDILDISMIQEGKLRINKELFSLFQTFKFIKNIFSQQAEFKGVKLKIRYSSQKEYIFNDQRRIQQVLMNLVSNSLKFTKKGGEIELISEDVKDQKQQNQLISQQLIQQSESQDFIKIIVQDTGVGMKDEVIKNLFKDFSTFDNDEGMNKQGIGLGLGICKKIVNQLGIEQEIEVQSQVNQGSQFSFFLNTVDRKTNFSQIRIHSFKNLESDQVIEQISYGILVENKMFKYNDQNSKGMPPLRKIDSFQNKFKKNLNPTLQNILQYLQPNSKFLIIDDDVFNIKGLQIMFKQTDIQVVGRLSVDEGIQELIKNEEKIENKPYSLIFIDVNMPEVSGILGAQKIKTLIKQGSIKSRNIVQYSGSSLSNLDDISIQQNSDFFVQKPLNFDKILTIVRSKEFKLI